MTNRVAQFFSEPDPEKPRPDSADNNKLSGEEVGKQRQQPGDRIDEEELGRDLRELADSLLSGDDQVPTHLQYLGDLLASLRDPDPVRAPIIDEKARKLIRMYVYRELPLEALERISGLALRFPDTWGETLSAEFDRRLAYEDGRDS